MPYFLSKLVAVEVAPVPVEQKIDDVQRAAGNEGALNFKQGLGLFIGLGNTCEHAEHEGGIKGVVFVGKRPAGIGGEVESGRSRRPRSTSVSENQCRSGPSSRCPKFGKRPAIAAAESRSGHPATRTGKKMDVERSGEGFVLAFLRPVGSLTFYDRPPLLQSQTYIIQTAPTLHTHEHRLLKPVAQKGVEQVHGFGQSAVAYLMDDVAGLEAELGSRSAGDNGGHGNAGTPFPLPMVNPHRELTRSAALFASSTCG